MAKIITDDQHYIDIATTIREKTDSEETFKPSEMADEDVIDEFGNPTGEIKLGFTNTFVQVHKDYDFDKNELEIYSIQKGDGE